LAPTRFFNVSTAVKIVRFLPTIGSWNQYGIIPGWLIEADALARRVGPIAEGTTLGVVDMPV
jgi:hypothetical protein